MKTINTLFCLLSLVTLVTLSPLTHAQDAPIPTSQNFKLDQRWEWAQLNNQTHKPEWPFFRTVVVKDGEKQFFDGNNYRVISQSFLGETPSMHWRVWPLTVGAKWTYENNEVKHVDGSLFTIKQEVEVVSYETITVAAGTFMAFKIVHTGVFINSRGTGTMNDIYWYAPSIYADIKYTSDDGQGYFYNRELQKYSE
jgi:hypothetical protein